MPRESSIKMKATSARATSIRSSIQRTDSPSVMLGQIADKPDESGFASDVAGVGQTPIVNPISTVRSEVNDGHKEVMDTSEQNSRSSNDLWDKIAKIVMEVNSGWDKPVNNTPVRKEVVDGGLDASIGTSVPVTRQVMREGERKNKRARDELESGEENLFKDVSVPEIVDEEAAGDVESDQPGGGQVSGCDSSSRDTSDRSSDNYSPPAGANNLSIPAGGPPGRRASGGVHREKRDKIMIPAESAGLPPAMFDLAALTTAAQKKYTNGTGVVTRADRRAFLQDLKKVAVVTFLRGFNVKKIFTRWTDRVELVKFMGICTRLGIKSTVSLAPAKDELTLFRALLLVPYAHPKYCITYDKPGVIQIHKIPKASHCRSFCSIVPNTDDWLGVFYSGICYLIYRDNILNMKSSKHRKVSQIVAFADGTRAATTSLSNEEKIAEMRVLGITEEIRISFLALPNSFQEIMEINTKHAIETVEMIFGPMKDIW